MYNNYKNKILRNTSFLLSVHFYTLLKMSTETRMNNGHFFSIHNIDEGIRCLRVFECPLINDQRIPKNHESYFYVTKCLSSPGPFVPLLFEYFIEDPHSLILRKFSSCSVFFLSTSLCSTRNY